MLNLIIDWIFFLIWFNAIWFKLRMCSDGIIPFDWDSHSSQPSLRYLDLVDFAFSLAEERVYNQFEN